MNKLIFTSLLALSASGCSSFDISTDSEQKEGIPFYAKKGVVKQTTSYSRSWLEVTMEYSELDKDGKAIPGSKSSAKFDLNLNSYTEGNFVESGKIIKQLLKKNLLPNNIDEIVNKFKEVYKTKCSNDCIIPIHEKSKEQSPSQTSTKYLKQAFISNSTKYETIVDYSKKYYFNTKIPIFGTTTGTASLASDGTLTSATSSIDTTKLADVIPLNEFLLKKYELGDYHVAEVASNSNDTKSKPTITEQNKKPLITFSVTKKSYQYNLSKYYDISGNSKESANDLNRAPIKFTDSQLLIDVITKADSKKKENKKKPEDKNTIKLNGTIQLPKE